ncbi:MAG: hypothetical protein EOP78_07360 [Variovorax sp.]|nr:MAG: hypothetical protein EOP78_07360 [Variovorax sp.]
MSSSLTLFARRAAVTLACVAPFGWAVAQTAPLPAPAAAEAAPSPEQDPRRNQKIENIRTEDAGARVDEVRYGGRTQSIAVQPKANVPGYEVMPDSGMRPDGSSNGSGTGPRVWNVLKF